MKKLILLMMLMLVLSISSVSALSTLSSSKIDFESNNALYNGPAFVVLGVENGGNDIITWTIDNFENELEGGYEMSASGTISSDFKPEGWTYPIQFADVSYDGKVVGRKTWIFNSDADSWCQGLGGDLWVSTTSYFSRACIDVYIDGYFFKLNQGEYDYEVDYTLSVSGQGSDTFTLSDTTNVGGTMIGGRNWFQAVRQYDGVSPRADPDINDKMWLYWNKETSRWGVIDPYPSTGNLGYDKFTNYFFNCMPSVGIGDYSQSCINDWNSNVVNPFFSSNFNYVSGVDTSDARVSSSGLGTGSIKFNDGNVYRNPVVTLTINADKVGVYRVFGKGDIVSIDYPDKMVVGEPYPITVVTKNVGDADMDASLSFNCGAYSVSGISQRFTLSPGETNSDSGTITYRGTVIGCSTGNKCVMTIQNTNAVGVDDTYDFTPKVCQMNECDVEGASDCVGNTIRKCVNVNGVLKYETVSTCSGDEVCEESGNYAFCKSTGGGQQTGYCGDSICDPSLGENSANCPSDCSIAPPICGDGLCDGREREGMEYECLDDCPIGTTGGSVSWVVILVIIMAFVIIGFAFYLRIKKEGYI